jgi:TolB protein
MRKFVLLGVMAWGLIAAVGYTVALGEDTKEGEIPEITISGDKQLVPVGLPNLVQMGGSDPRDFKSSLRKVLAYDLAVCGLFKVLDLKSYLASPSEGIEPATINFDSWVKTGAQLLIKSGFTLSGSRLQLEGRLYEVSQGQGNMVLNKSFAGDASDARHLAHLWANSIVKYFTKEDGIFTTRIAYSRRSRIDGEIAKNLHVIDFDGNGRRALTNNKGLNLLPRWSPDGAAVIASSTMNRKWQVVRISLASGRVKVISNQYGSNLAGGYSPDGGKIAVTLSKDGNSEIYLLTPTGSILQRLTEDRGIDTSPTFSPDGTRIAWVSDRSGTPQIYVMNANGTGQRRLTFKGKYNQEPDWSPKGDSILFTGRDDSGGRFDIFTVDPSNGSIERMTQGAGMNEHAKWSPDARHLVFASTRGGGSGIWLMWADRTNTRPLSQAGLGSYTPAWSPRFQ